MPQSFARIYIHLIFSTKKRELWIDDAWAPRLFEYFGGILNQRGHDLLAAGGIEDHVHLLISISREASISEIVRDLKSISTNWVHDAIPDQIRFAWQAGYAAFSVSHSALNEVKRYFHSQREHHRKRSFQEELIAFLEKHDIEYDTRYLWD